MTCCIVGLLILSVVGRIRRVTGGGRDTEATLFAPVACRPAPGQTLPIAHCEGDSESPSAVAVLRYAAAGVVLCLLAGPLLVWTGLMENTGSTTTWLLRAVCYLTAIAMAVVLSRTVPRWRELRGAGWALIALGAVIFEAGILDMHVFKVFEVSEVEGENLTADLIFHNVGPVIAVIGGLVLLYGAAGRRSTSRRSSRSTVTNARPSSSAVTVSSTPPVTM